MNKNIKKAGIAIVVLFAAAQIIRPSIDNPPVDPKKDFAEIEKAPENIKIMLKKSCYDCHSNETVYPWYSQIVPVSWYLKKHIDNGREEMNFSTWADFRESKKSRRLKGAAKLIRGDKMPLWDYKLIHADSRLNDQEKEELAVWFEKRSDYYYLTVNSQFKPHKPVNK